MQSAPRLSQFRLPDIVRPVKNLALKIGSIDAIGVHQSESADPGCRQIESRRRTESAGADAQNPRRLDPPLPIGAHFRQEQLARGTGEVARVERDLSESFLIDNAHGLGFHERPIDSDDSLALEAL